jgi:hypothetical protein
MFVYYTLKAWVINKADVSVSLISTNYYLPVAFIPSANNQREKLLV